MPEPLQSLFQQLATQSKRVDGSNTVVTYRGSWTSLQAVQMTAFVQTVQRWQCVIEQLDSRFIAVYQKDGTELAAAILACWELGKTAVIPANNRPELLQAWPSLARQVAGLATGSAANTAAAAALARSNYHGGNFALAMSEQLPHSPSTNGETDALVLFTSGSSGQPSAVAKSFGQLNAELHSLEQQWGTQVADSLFVSSVSRQHMFGLPFSLLWPLARGSAFCCQTMHFLEPLAVLAQQHPLTLITSPAQLQHLPPQLQAAQFHGNIQQVFSAGAPLAATAASAARKLFGQAVTEVYGCTEAGAIAWRQQHQGCDWQPLPGNRLRIISRSSYQVSDSRPSHHQLGDNQFGDQQLGDRKLGDQQLLQLQSKASGYPQSWLSLDDAATITAGGHFLLHGRVDRIVKVGSKRISLTAIENALTECELVDTAKALQLTERKSRIAVAVVLSASGKAALIDQGKAKINAAMRDWLRPRVEQLALPRYWRYITAMPQDSQGKTSTAQLQNFFFEERQPRVAEVIQEKRIGNQLNLQLRVPIDLLYFNGHFPGEGVLPGVIQINWAVDFIRQAFPEMQRFSRLENIKFQQMIRPGNVIELELLAQPDRQRVLFRYHNQDSNYSSGRIVFSNVRLTTE